jgi:hypothetical protein
MSQKTACVPAFVGPSNSAAVLGVPWPRARSVAKRLGVRFVPFGKLHLVPFAELVSALEREAHTQGGQS